MIAAGLYDIIGTNCFGIHIKQTYQTPPGIGKYMYFKATPDWLAKSSDTHWEDFAGARSGRFVQRLSSILIKLIIWHYKIETHQGSKRSSQFSSLLFYSINMLWKRILNIARPPSGIYSLKDSEILVFAHHFVSSKLIISCFKHLGVYNPGVFITL